MFTDKMALASKIMERKNYKIYNATRWRILGKLIDPLKY
jgi:hypothetical protein